MLKIKNMKDYAIERGYVKKVDSNSDSTKGFFFLRKMFREYLNKLNIGFYDSCCIDASTKLPVYVDKVTNVLTYVNTSGVNTPVTVGGGNPSYRAITAPTTITIADSTINATANTFSQPLPASTIGNAGKIFTIKNSGAGVITVTATGGQLIDGVATRVINPTESIPFQSTGTGYVIL